MAKNNFNGDTRNQKPLNPINAPAALRVESRRSRAMKRRKINNHEVKIVQKMAGEAGFEVPANLSEFDVLVLDDGGMGSVAFVREDKPYEERKLGGVIGKFDYKDSDGIDILMHLFKDEDGYLYELDVWKGSLEPRISYPDL